METKKDLSLKTFYHGTNVVFDNFSIDCVKNGWFGKCFYFTDDKSIAKGYGKRVFEVSLEMKNPYVAKENMYQNVISDVNKQFNKENSIIEDDCAKLLLENGFDGIVYKHWDAEVGNMYMVFKPEQIKVNSIETNKSAKRQRR